MKNKAVFSLSFLMLIYAYISAQTPYVSPTPYFRSAEPLNVPCLTSDQHEAISAKLDSQRTLLIEHGLLPEVPDKRAIQQFIFPLKQASGVNTYGYYSTSNYVDHDPTYPNNISDYNCGTRSYDTPSGYNHGGTDFILWPFGWNQMANDEVEVISGAAGIIIYKDDGNFDKNCSFSSDPWNAVFVQHADGSIAWYGHLKKNSATSKGVGLPVSAGEYLGMIGSSGSSTGPHLHFEVHDNLGNPIDPYSGTCNILNSSTWWQNQPAYVDAGINRIRTANAPPTFANCPDLDTTHEWDYFTQLDTVYVVLYFRNLSNGDSIHNAVKRPDATTWNQWSFSSPWPFYTAAYAYWTIVIGASEPSGVWTFETKYLGNTYTHEFNIGLGSGIESGIARNEYILVYPNPSSGRINIRSHSLFKGDIQTRIYDLSGKEILRKDHSAVNASDEINMDVSTLMSGLYILTLHSAWGISHKKLLIR